MIMKYLFSTIVAFAALSGFNTGALAQDAKAGEKKAAMCIGCHGIPGYQSSFPEVHKVPMISGQGAKYIAAALTAYQKGDRKHPTMRAIAAPLTEQDTADLAAFYEAQAKDVPPADVSVASKPTAEVAKLLEQGGCSACHGENFNKPIDGTYPKLAGQHADYLYTALKAYKSKDSAQVGRNNAVMGATVQPFTHAQLKVIAQYLATLPSDLRTVPQSRFR